MANLSYPRPKEAGLVTARRCEALDGGWIVVYDRRKKGPTELEQAVKAGVEEYAVGKMNNYVLMYRPDPDECRTWATKAKMVTAVNHKEAVALMVAIAGGNDKLGMLPVADGALLGGLNQRQFLFCQMVLCGVPRPEAYVRAGYKSKAPNEEATKLEDNPQVSRYLKQQRSIQVKNFTLTKEAILRYQQDVLETPAGAVDKMHYLCQEYTETEDMDKIKMPSKDGAAKLITTIMGWDKQTEAISELAVSVGAMAQVMREKLTRIETEKP